MQTLFGRAAAYARREGLELQILTRPMPEAYLLIYFPTVAVVYLDTATAAGPTCGELVYAACEAYRRSRAAIFTVRECPRELRATA